MSHRFANVIAGSTTKDLSLSPSLRFHFFPRLQARATAQNEVLQGKQRCYLRRQLISISIAWIYTKCCMNLRCDFFFLFISYFSVVASRRLKEKRCDDNSIFLRFVFHCCCRHTLLHLSQHTHTHSVSTPSTKNCDTKNIERKNCLCAQWKKQRRETSR